MAFSNRVSRASNWCSVIALGVFAIVFIVAVVMWQAGTLGADSSPCACRIHRVLRVAAELHDQDAVTEELFHRKATLIAAEFKSKLVNVEACACLCGCVRRSRSVPSCDHDGFVPPPPTAVNKVFATMFAATPNMTRHQFDFQAAALRETITSFAPITAWLREIDGSQRDAFTVWRAAVAVVTSDALLLWPLAVC